MTIMTVPITPVSSHSGAGYCADSRASATTYDATNDCTAQSRLRKCILHRYRHSQSVRKNPGQVGFAVNPRRWVVERFFAWIGRNRRLAKDFEATIGSARAFLYSASVMSLVRRIADAS